LLVAIYGHPELSISPFVGLLFPRTQGSRPVGLLVDNDGSVQLPLIGRVVIAGQTTQQVQVLVEQQLART